MKDKYIFDDPGEVMAQINTMAWLLGQTFTYGTITEEQALGLQCLMFMISDNVKSTIEGLMERPLKEAP